MKNSENIEIAISSHTTQVLHIRNLPKKGHWKKTHYRIQWWVHGATAPTLPITATSIGLHRDTYSESCHV